MALRAREQQKQYTAEDVYQLSLQGLHYELLQGELIEVAPTKQTHGAVTGEILRQVANFVRERKLGAVYAAETGFVSSTGDVLAPEMSFTVKGHIEPEKEGFTTVAPDLAVEIFSPNNKRVEIQEKVEAYFAAGVRQVWIVYARSRTVYVYSAADKVVIRRQDDLIEGADVLPGFTLKVSDIFSVLDE